MITEREQIQIRGTPVSVIRKPIKNLHIGVYPPDGRVRVAAPSRLTDDAVRLAIISRFGWIRRQQARFAEQARQSAREMVTGESHYFQGRRYRLHVVEHAGPPRVSLLGTSTLELRIRPNTDPARRRAILDQWYRDRLHEQIPPEDGHPLPRLADLPRRTQSCPPVARGMAILKRDVSVTRFSLTWCPVPDPRIAADRGRTGNRRCRHAHTKHCVYHVALSGHNQRKAVFTARRAAEIAFSGAATPQIFLPAEQILRSTLRAGQHIRHLLHPPGHDVGPLRQAAALQVASDCDL